MVCVIPLKACESQKSLLFPGSVGPVLFPLGSCQVVHRMMLHLILYILGPEGKGRLSPVESFHALMATTTPNVIPLQGPFQLCMAVPLVMLFRRAIHLSFLSTCLSRSISYNSN